MADDICHECGTTGHIETVRGYTVDCPSCTPDKLRAALSDAAAREAVMLGALKSLRWKSIDRDNMEYRCETTYFVKGQIDEAIANASPRAKALLAVVEATKKQRGIETHRHGGFGYKAPGVSVVLDFASDVEANAFVAALEGVTP